MSTTNNNNNINTTNNTQSTSLADFMPSANGIAAEYLYKLGEIYSKMERLNTQLLNLMYKSNRQNAKAAAHAAVKEAEKDATSAIFGAVGGMVEGAVSIGAGHYMSRDNPQMKEYRDQINNAKEWQIPPRDGDKSLTVSRNGTASNSGNIKPDELELVEMKASDKEAPQINENKPENKLSKEEVKVKDSQEEVNQASDEPNEETQKKIDKLKGEDAIREDIFGTKLDSSEYKDALDQANPDEKKEISENADKYIKSKEDKLSNLANGAKRTLQSQMIQGIGKMLNGAFGILSANTMLQKRKYIRQKYLAQNDMDLSKTMISQYLQQFNSIVQSQFAIYNQTLTALARAGISPS